MSNADLPPTRLQLATLAHLTHPTTRLRWNSQRHPSKATCGRGHLLRDGQYLPNIHDHTSLLASHTVRQLIRSDWIQPIDPANRKPFNEGGNPYRDYCITARGRATLARYAPQDVTA